MSHRHDDGHWPFDSPPDTAVFTTRQVLEGHPILEVHHDPDGDWQFVCGTTSAREDGRLVCLGCFVNGQPGLAQLADIPIGWFAYRSSPDQPWARTRYEGPWD